MFESTRARNSFTSLPLSRERERMKYEDKIALDEPLRARIFDVRFTKAAGSLHQVHSNIPHNCPLLATRF